MVRSKYHSRLFDLALIGACIFLSLRPLYLVYRFTVNIQCVAVEVYVAVVCVGIVEAGDLAVAGELDLGFLVERQLYRSGTVVAVDRSFVV